MTKQTSNNYACVRCNNKHMEEVGKDFIICGPCGFACKIKDHNKADIFYKKYGYVEINDVHTQIF